MLSLTSNVHQNIQSSSSMVTVAVGVRMLMPSSVDASATVRVSLYSTILSLSMETLVQSLVDPLCRNLSCVVTAT